MTGRSLQAVVTALLLLAVQRSQAAAEENSYSYKMLNSPSEAVLSAEANGRVTIYDGLKSKTIDRAMDRQFNRIENMMFIRTRHPQKNGEYETDDDC